ncbi:MAG: YdeI/OmpD-associated family protein [Pseudomonadota bacterium]
MTDGYVSFQTTVTPVEWGRSTYTVIVLPDSIAEHFAATGTKRVEGEINDHPINVGLAKADAMPGTFIWAGKAFLEAAGIEPGTKIELRLRAADPNQVDVPNDVVSALTASGKLADWNALTPGKQRGFLHQVNTAKRAETRHKRIQKLVEMLE